MSKQEIRHYLLTKLKQENSFWSYNEASINKISDEMLIEKVLIHLDLDEINMLFKLFSYNKIKQVWIDNLIPQEEYYHTLNRFFSWYYFHVKHPDSYLKSMTTRYYNKLLAS